MRFRWGWAPSVSPILKGKHSITLAQGKVHGFRSLARANKAIDAFCSKHNIKMTGEVPNPLTGNMKKGVANASGRIERTCTVKSHQGPTCFCPFGLRLTGLDSNGKLVNIASSKQPSDLACVVIEQRCVCVRTRLLRPACVQLRPAFAPISRTYARALMSKRRAYLR